MRVEVLQNAVVIESRDLTDGNYTIGRSSSNAFCLKSPQISKSHALLVVKGGRAAILDVGSSNGVFVNGILIKKTRIEMGDDIVLGPFRMRIVPMIDRAQPPPGRVELSQVGGGAGGAVGNAARKLDFSDLPDDVPQTLTPQDKVLAAMDEKILTPFYATIARVDWRVVMATIVGAALVAAVLLSVIPFVNWGERILVGESIARGQTVLRQMVRENFRVVSKTNDSTRLTVESYDKEPGVIGAYIADPATRTLLAPSKYYSKAINDLYVLRAMEKLNNGETKEGDREEVAVEREDGTYILAQPLYVYSSETNRSLVGVAILEFEVPNNIYSTFTPVAEMVLLAILLGLMSYYLLVKMFSYPISRMLDGLDAALKGEGGQVTAEMKFPELEGLAQNINFALSRVKQGDGGSVGLSSPSDDSLDDTLLKVVENVDSASRPVATRASRAPRSICVSASCRVWAKARPQILILTERTGPWWVWR
ncbi:MAG: FHA domain-containing protein [Deltaproteobacteria bacterium]|nr:FHA domain-containing protein [Deltaproteobacteria bacterium]